MFSCLFHKPGNDLQQNPASVHLQHVYGGDDAGADQQPGCYRDQPADVVPLPLPQPVGHACAGGLNGTSIHFQPCLISRSDVSVKTFFSASLCFFADCDGSDPALLFVGLECFGWSVCHSSAGSGPVPHSYKAGRHTKKLTSKQYIYILVLL